MGETSNARGVALMMVDVTAAEPLTPQAAKRRASSVRQTPSELLIERRVLAERKWTVDKLDMFLGMLAETGNATRAAKHVGMSLSGAQSMRSRDPLVRRMWDEAKTQYREQVEAAILKRAAGGVKQTVTRTDGKKSRTTVFDSRLSIEALRLAGQSVREVVYAEQISDAPGQAGESARLRLQAQLAALANRIGEECE